MIAHTRLNMVYKSPPARLTGSEDYLALRDFNLYFLAGVVLRD